MAPMRHRYDSRLYRRASGHGHQMVPRAAVNGMGPGYRTSSGGSQSGGGPAYGDGLYNAGSYQAEKTAQQGSNDGSYRANQQSQQGAPRQGSSGTTSNDGAYQGSRGNQQSKQNRQTQQSQQSTGRYGQSGSSQQNSGSYEQSGSSPENAGGQRAQQQTPSDGSYHANQKGAEQQKSSPGTYGSTGYQSNYASQSKQQSQNTSPNENAAPGTSYGTAHNVNVPSAQDPKAQANSHSNGYNSNDLSSVEQNELPAMLNHDASYANQHNPKVPSLSDPPLATDTMLPTSMSSGTSTSSTTSSSQTTTSTPSPTSSSTSSPTTSSTTSPTASSAPSSNGLTAYQSACAGFSVALGIVLIAGVFLVWLHRRRRQQKQKPTPMPSEQIYDGSHSETSSAKPRPSEKLHSTFHDGMAALKTSAAKKGHAARRSFSSVKKRASSLYGTFVGTAVGTGMGALGAVRKSLYGARLANVHHRERSIRENSERPSNEDNGNTMETNERGVHDLSATEKGNTSTPTLVVSPTDPSTRELSPTVRHVPSGRPQMERSASSDDRAGMSTTPETDAGQGDNQTDTASPRGQNLLAITSMVPFLSSQYRVEIAFSAKKPGQMDLREGQCVMIRQSYDDGWVLCSPGEGGTEGFAPRACLSPWPVKSGSPNNSDGSRTPDSVSAPGTPRFYSHFFSARSVT